MSGTRTAQLLFASLFPLALMACGSSSPEAAPGAASTASAPSQASAPPPATAPASARERLEHMRAAALPTGDCTLLSETALRRHFPSAPTEMETRVRAKPYPSCTYLWVSATPNKLNMAGQVIEVPGEGRVTITVAPTQVPDSDWERVLSSYRAAPPEAVDGIGDKAVWSDQRHQLSVLAPASIIHVAVEDNDTPDTGREQAVAIAREVLAGLQ